MQDRHHISGIREPLPHGETLLWEGRPDSRMLARHVLHIRVVAIYFAALLAWTVFTPGEGVSLLARVSWIALQAAVVLGVFAGFAHWMARTSLYSITNRRVMILKGVVLPSVVNIPFRRIQNIRFHERNDGSGGIALELVAGGRVGMTFLWPHMRPWKLRNPEPMLRCVPQVEEAATVLKDAYTVFLEDGGPEPQTGPTEYRLLDDDDTPVLFNQPLTTASTEGSGGAG